MTGRRTLLVGALVATTLARWGHAQTGLVVVAHGADSAWNAKVREVVAGVEWPHGPQAVAFLMGAEAHTAGWDSAVARLARGGATSGVVVPLLVSSFSGHYRQVRYYAGTLDTLDVELLRHRHASLVPPPLRLVVTPALDSAPELRAAMVDRWRALPPDHRRAPVILVAHGPNDDGEAAAWAAHLEGVAAAIRGAGAPAAQVHLLRDDAPPLVRAGAVAAMRDSVLGLARTHGDSVVALPLLISTGAITRSKIPRDLAGLPVRYDPVVLAPHPALARWVGRVANAAMRAELLGGR